MNRKHIPWYKQKKTWIIGAIAVALVLLFVLTNKQAEDSAREAMLKDLKTVEVTEGSIQSHVIGTGNLDFAEADDVSAPTGVIVDHFVVEAGDAVEAGQPIAVLDKVSIASQISLADQGLDSVKTDLEADDLSDIDREVLLAKQSAYESRKSELNALRQDPTIYAKKSGVIASIEVEAGQALTQNATGLSNGSSGSGLSLDPSQFENMLIQSVTQSYRGQTDRGILFATLEDGRSVRVSIDSSTETDAQRTAEMNAQPAAQPGSAAMPQASEASPEESVDSSAPVDSSQPAEPTPPTDSSTPVESSEPAESSAPAESSEPAESSTPTESSEPAESSTPEESSAPSESSEPTQPTNPTNPSEPAALIVSFSSFQIEAPVYGKAPQTKIAETADYTGTIQWIPQAQTFAADCNYVAVVALQAKPGHAFTSAVKPTVEGAVAASTVIGDGTPGNLLLLTAAFPQTGSVAGEQTPPFSQQTTQEQVQAYLEALAKNAAGSLDQMIDAVTTKIEEEAGNLTEGLQEQVSAQLAKSISSLDLSGLMGQMNLSGMQMPSIDTSNLAIPNMSLGNMSNLNIPNMDAASGLGLGSGSSAAAASQIDTRAKIATLAPRDERSLTIQVDELDILLVEEGQPASVSVDAIRGKTFQGTVEKIAKTAVQTSGSAKYEVVLSVPADTSMFVGMSASATIETRNVDQAMILPLEAIQESNGESFVYTRIDPNGGLVDPVAVETGLSDGTSVEITKGLAVGDTVAYRVIQQSIWEQMPGMRDSTEASDETFDASEVTP